MNRSGATWLVILAVFVAVAVVGVGQFYGDGTDDRSPSDGGEPAIAAEPGTGDQEIRGKSRDGSDVGPQPTADADEERNGATDPEDQDVPDDHRLPSDRVEELRARDGPTERRYVNAYEQNAYRVGDPPTWFPEENLSMPEDLTHHAYEVTRYPYQTPTAEEIDAAWRLYNRTYRAVEKNGWFEEGEALDDGYIYVNRHYPNLEHRLDDARLDPNRPEFLVYYQHPDQEDEKILAGVMYDNIRATGEQIAGPLTVWHYHPFRPVVGVGVGSQRGIRKQLAETKYDDLDEFRREFLGNESPVMRYRGGEMLHVWLVRHPEGPFGSTMSVPPENLREPEKMNRSAFERYLIETSERRYSIDVSNDIDASG